MTTFTCILLPLLLILSGCTSSQGLHVESLQRTLQEEEARFAEVQPATSAPNPLPGQGPPKLGLYVMPTGFLRHEFEWTDADRETLLTWAHGLQRDGLISGALLIPNSSLQGNTLAPLLESAARYGADILLVVAGAAAVDRYNNYKSPLLYWTILGAYFANGTHSDALCLVRGSVWDVRTRTLRSSEETEGRAQTVGPAAFVDDQTMVLLARQEALATLLPALKARGLRPRTP